MFPGGSTETGDGGPAATARQEAAEETGINPTRVHIIGSLPPLALSATRFLVTPVVGWCTRGQLTDSLCPEEVAVAVRVPLDEFANLSGRVQRNPEASTSAARFIVDGTAVGPMTSIVIDALLDKGCVPIRLAADVPGRDDGLREPVDAERGNAFCRAGRTEAQLAFTVMSAHAVT